MDADSPALATATLTLALLNSKLSVEVAVIFTSYSVPTAREYGGSLNTAGL
jgi:hypothetical protein